MKELSESDQMVLEQFFDDETGRGLVGLYRRLQARKLLRRSEEAKAYYYSLESVRAQCVSLGRDEAISSQGSDDMQRCWDALEARILAEEKAEVLLGKRSLHAEGDQSFSLKNFFSVEGLSSFGASLGSVAALATVAAVVVLGPQIYGTIGTSGSDSQQLASRSKSDLSERKLDEIEWIGTQPVELVSSMASPSRAVNRDIPDLSSHVVFRGAPYSNSPYMSVSQQQPQQAYRAGVPRSIRRNSGRTVEVDWVKSDGSVRMIHGPAAKAPILWVRKRVPRVSASRASSGIKRVTGRIIITPKKRTPVSEKNSQGIVIQKRVVPQASYANSH